MSAAPSNSERLLELLADRATGGLAVGGAAEIDRLLADHPAMNEDEMELCAAALMLAEVGPVEQGLPAHLAQRIEADAQRRLESMRAVGPVSEAPRSIPFPRTRPSDARAGSIPAWSGWLAAAAALLLAVIGWWPRGSTTAPQSGTTGGSVTGTAPPVARSPAQGLADLLRVDPSALKVAWVMPAPDSPDPACAGGCAGEVVWSNTLQKGFMVFKGLAANDPSTSQYQLWIFDKDRPESTPVDGGVFDVTGTGEVVVPIDAKLKVGEPILFAVTVEQPGGVVVSKRERIPVLAKVGA